MLRERAAAHRAEIRSELEAISAEDHPPHDVAASFATGVFITTLPTLGTGLLLFGVIVYLFDRVSKVALFASVLVLNPAAKWGVYVASFWLRSSSGQCRASPVRTSRSPRDRTWSLACSSATPFSWFSSPSLDT